MRITAFKFYLIGLVVILITLFLMTACAENAISTPAVFSPDPGLNNGPGNSLLPAGSPGVNKTVTAGGSENQSEGEKTTPPQRLPIQMEADPTTLRVGDNVTISGNSGQTPVLDYTLLLNSNEFVKDTSRPGEEGGPNDSKQLFKFVSASRKGNRVMFVLKANQPGKATVSLKASSEASYLSGGKPITALFTISSNSTGLTVVS